MAGWNGSGTFVRLYNWVADKAASIKIVASRMDGEFDNYKTGLENCLTRDGQNSPSANISWNSKKITSLANGTASTDAANYGQITGVSTGNAFRKNMLANGGFDVWQSGAGGSASITGTASRIRTADCWWAVRASSATGYTVSQQTGESSRYALKWQRDNGNASTAIMYLAQQLETQDSVWLKRGTPPTLYLSFKAKKGANYSGGDLTAWAIRGTGTDQSVLDGFTGATTIATLTQTLTTTLTKYSVAVPCDASTNQIGVQFAWTPTGAAGADDSITLEEVQLEASSAATDFERLPFSDTLAQCMRYYTKTFAYGTAPAQSAGDTSVLHWVCAAAGAVTQGAFSYPFPVPFRASPTVTTYNPSAANAHVRNLSVAGDHSNTLAVLYGPLGVSIQSTGNAGGSAGNTLSVHLTATDANF